MPQHASFMPRHDPEFCKNKTPRTLSLFHSSKPYSLTQTLTIFPQFQTLYPSQFSSHQIPNSSYPFQHQQVFNLLLQDLEIHWRIGKSWNLEETPTIQNSSKFWFVVVLWVIIDNCWWLIHLVGIESAHILDHCSWMCWNAKCLIKCFNEISVLNWDWRSKNWKDSVVWISIVKGVRCIDKCW